MGGARHRKKSRGGDLDNTALIEEILSLRREEASLFGHSNFAEFSLGYKMAESTTKVRRFLNNLIQKARPVAIREYKQLAIYAKKHDGIEVLEPWDIYFYLEHIKAEKRAISTEELKKYFPLTNVLLGMFTVAKLLYGISFQERKDAELWHPDAVLYDVFCSRGRLLGGLYLDLYERPGEKVGSAWADVAVVRRELQDGSIQLPVGYLVCNFSRGTKEKSALLTMGEVKTLFHEFGHCLHLLLTKVRTPDISGVFGIHDDGGELPSLFMENFSLEPEVLDLISCHCETGKKLPQKIFKNICAARRFGSGLYITWLITRSIFDLRLYTEYNYGKKGLAQSLYNEIQDDPRPIFFSEYPWRPESFTHIFGDDDLQAGYFGYPWAEMLALDARSMFIKRGGKIDWTVGRSLEREILSRGGSRLMMDNFVAFRGRKPTIDALLHWYGLDK